MVSSKTNKKKNDVIKFSKMLNDKKLSALRSGNISVRHKNGFLITPSWRGNKKTIFMSNWYIAGS